MEVARQPGVLPLLPQPPPCRGSSVVLTKSLSFYFTNRDSGARCWGEKRYCVIPCYYYCQLSKQISDSVPHPPNHQALETEGKRCGRGRRRQKLRLKPNIKHLPRTWRCFLFGAPWLFLVWAAVSGAAFLPLVFTVHFFCVFIHWPRLTTVTASVAV